MCTLHAHTCIHIRTHIHTNTHKYTQTHTHTRWVFCCNVYYTLYKHRDICNLLEHKSTIYVWFTSPYAWTLLCVRVISKCKCKLIIIIIYKQVACIRPMFVNSCFSSENFQDGLWVGRSIPLAIIHISAQLKIYKIKTWLMND